MPTEHSHAHCADEETEAPKGEITFSKPHGQGSSSRPELQDPGVATEMSGLRAWESKKGMGFLEELMKATRE